MKNIDLPLGGGYETREAMLILKPKTASIVTNRILAAGVPRVLAALFVVGISLNAAYARSLTFNPGSLSVGLSGVTQTAAPVPFALSTFSFGGATVLDNAVKLQGNETYTDTNGGGGTITISFTGTGSADAGDTFSLAYDFSLILTGTGTVTPTVSVDAVVFGFLRNVSETLSLAGPGTTNYGPGNKASSPSPLNASATYTATATLVWTGGSAGDTLQVIVPGSSIDFGVGPTAVPEPASAGLVLAGASLLTLVTRRRGSTDGRSER